MTQPADSSPLPPRSGGEPDEDSSPHTSAESHSYLAAPDAPTPAFR